MNENWMQVMGIDHTVSSVRGGAYWRLLVPGEYSVTVEAEDYHSKVGSDWIFFYF